MEVVGLSACFHSVWNDGIIHEPVPPVACRHCGHQLDIGSLPLRCLKPNRGYAGLFSNPDKDIIVCMAGAT